MNIYIHALDSIDDALCWTYCNMTTLVIEFSSPPATATTTTTIYFVMTSHHARRLHIILRYLLVSRNYSGL